MKNNKLKDPRIVTKYINVVYPNGETMVKPCRGWTDEEVESLRAAYANNPGIVRAWVS